MSTILYNWKIAGEAGYGIMNTGGPIFAKTLTRGGFFVFIYSEYPSLIRGGHNTMQVAVADEPITSTYRDLDQLIALDTTSIIWHQDEVKPGGVILYDPHMVKMKEDGTFDTTRIPPLTGTVSVAHAREETKKRDDITYTELAFEKIAEEIGGNKIMRNVASIGGALAVCSKCIKPKEDVLSLGKGVLADIFGAKGEKIVSANQKVLEAGYKAIHS